jgi:gamma-soluble NSF attachment protein
MPREDEGDALMAQAKAHHTKSLTKWSSDWDSAASAYEKAAQMFTHLGAEEKAKNAWLMASQAHEKAKNPFFAAKAIDSLANFLKDKASKNEVVAKEVSELYVRASRMYALDGKPERQADALAKAARLAPAGDAAAAAKLVLQGLDALEDSDKHHLTLDLYRSVVLLQVRGNLILDAITTLKREVKTFEKLQQTQGAAKAGLEIIVLCLAIGDWVLADREFKGMQGDFFGFAHSKEQSAAYGLISAIEERDEDALKDALKDSALQFIIPEISRMAKKLTINLSNAPAGKKKLQVGGSVSSNVAQAAQQDDDEDDLK